MLELAHLLLDVGHEVLRLNHDENRRREEAIVVVTLGKGGRDGVALKEGVAMRVHHLAVESRAITHCCEKNVMRVTKW